MVLPNMPDYKPPSEHTEEDRANRHAITEEDLGPEGSIRIVKRVKKDQESDQ